MIELELFVIFVTSLALTFSIIPLITKFSAVYGLYDYPDSSASPNSSARRVHASPTPRLGGIAMVTGFFASMLIWASPLPLRPIFAGSLFMFIIGLIDDLRPLSAKLKLLLQSLASVYVVMACNLGLENLVLLRDWSILVPPWVGQLLSVFILIGAINAINLSDGLDGLAGGVVLISIAILSMLHFLATQDIGLLLYVTVPLLGCLLGFLCYNTHPASIFMGDGGSTWLGFIIGAFILLVLNGASLHIEAKSLQLAKFNNSIPFICVLLCLAVPIADTAIVIIRRLVAGKKITAADKGHFHHTLLKIGLTHPESVLAIYFLAFLTGIMGLMPIAYPNYSLDWIPYSAAIGLSAVIIFSLQINEILYAKIVRIRDFLFSKRKSNPLIRHLIRYLFAMNRYLIYGIIVVAPLLAGVPPKSLGYTAIAAILMVLSASIISGTKHFFQSFVISISTTILLAAINFNTLSVSFMGQVYQVHNIYNWAFIALFAGSICYFFLTARAKTFIITPTDFLMLGLPLVLLLFPEPYKSDFKLNIISLRALILFLAIRVLTRSRGGTMRRIRLVCLVGLAYVALASICGLKIIY